MKKDKVTKKAKEPIRLREKKLANGSKSLYLDMYKDGERSFEFLKLYLIPERTNADKEQNKETLATANAVKSQRIVDLQNEQHGFTASSNKKKAKANFIKFMETQAESYEKKGSTAYANSVRNTINHLKEYKGDAVTFESVTKSYLLGYIDFLKKTKGKWGNALSEAAQALYFNIVVIALNKAVKAGIIQVNPVTKLDASDRPKQGEATKEYLTLDEVKKLAATDCDYPEVKRAFLFACFCGLRYSDVSGLTWSKIQTIENGAKRIQLRQQKTSNPLYLPLSTNALQWLPERGNAKDEDKVFAFPKIPTMEKCLREWAEAAGVKKHVTFHVSRHTNATLLLTYGADIYTVSKLLGHTSVKTTQIYAKIVDAKKRDAVNLIPVI